MTVSCSLAGKIIVRLAITFNKIPTWNFIIYYYLPKIKEKNIWLFSPNMAENQDKNIM